MWLLGVTLVRMTPVVLAGAASRVDGWEVDRAALRKLADEAPARYGEEFGVLLQSGDVEQIAYQDVRVPGVFLVRPTARSGWTRSRRSPSVASRTAWRRAGGGSPPTGAIRTSSTGPAG